MLNAALANDTWEGDDADTQRLQLNAFHHSGDAFDAMFRLANRSLVQTQQRRHGVARRGGDAVALQRAEEDVSWVRGAVNAASAAQQVWALTRAFTRDDAEAEQKLPGVLWRYLEHNTYFGSDDERSWFEEICGAVESQEYGALIIYHH